MRTLKFFDHLLGPVAILLAVVLIAATFVGMNPARAQDQGAAGPDTSIDARLIAGEGGYHFACMDLIEQGASTHYTQCRLGMSLIYLQSRLTDVGSDFNPTFSNDCTIALEELNEAKRQQCLFDTLDAQISALFRDAQLFGMATAVTAD